VSESIIRTTRRRYEKMASSAKQNADVIIVDGKVVKNREGKAGISEREFDLQRQRERGGR
jgi:hypothetical protein